MSRKQQPLIFIIDKNLSCQKVIVGCLKALKLHNIKTFNNGEDCYISDSPPADLIILDAELGKGNWTGIEFMQEYKQLIPSTNFIFLSSVTGVDLAVESIRKGGLDFIIKSKMGLARLTEQLEGVKLYHEKLKREKLAKYFIIAAIISFSAFTVIASILYATVQ
jgi:DNA-binding NtrC family response regulator